MQVASSHASILGSAMGGGPAVIDPAEKTWMGRGAILGLATGVIAGGGMALLDASENAKRVARFGTSHGPGHNPLVTLGAALALGVTIGTVGGYLIGHVEDEGWTIPGAP